VCTFLKSSLCVRGGALFYICWISFFTALDAVFLWSLVAFVCTINEFVGQDDPNYRESGPLR
jgi:hypothetical protein